jgi:hypothetical protein
MRMKKICFVFFIAITLIGFYSIGTVEALQFADWSGTWFKVKVSEIGKAGVVVSPLTPNGGEVVTNNEKKSDSYLKIQLFDIAGDPPFFLVGYCSFNGSVWATQRDLPMQVVGGEPTRFLALFNFERIQSQNITEQYWVPLEVKGKEASNTVGEINSASFKNLGGIFLEEIGNPVVTQRGIGSVTFTGSLVKNTAEEIEKNVPEGCRLTAPGQAAGE